MPKYQIKAPNGKLYAVDGPEGATDEQVRAEVLRQFPDAAPQEAAPAAAVDLRDPKVFQAEADKLLQSGKGRKELDALAVQSGRQPFGEDLDMVLEQRALGGRVQIAPPDEKPYSVLQSMNDGVNHVWNNAARAVEQIPGVDALQQFGKDYLGLAGSVAEAEKYQQEQRDKSGYRSGDAGKFLGEMIATAPLMRLPGGPITQGMAQGALTTNARDAGGVAIDAGLGGLGGKIGDLAFRGAARAIAPLAPKIGKNVRLLLDAGVKVTPGQVARDAGGAANRLAATAEDRAINQPVVGALVQADRQAGNESLGRAVANRALKQIDEVLPDNIPAGFETVAHVGDRLSAVIRDISPRLKGSIDRTFERRLGVIISRAKLPETVSKEVTQLMTETGHAFSLNPGATGTYSGRSLTNATDKLDKLAAAWNQAPDPYIRQIGEIAGQVRQELLSLAQRQNPAEAAKLRGFQKGWAILVRMENAAKGAKGGVYSPVQLSTAVRTSDRSVRKRAVGRGQALLQDLSDAASQVLPSTNPDSGTQANLMADTVFGNVKGGARALAYMGAKRDLGRSLTAGPQSRYVSDLLRRGAPVAGQAAAIAAPSMASAAVNP